MDDAEFAVVLRKLETWAYMISCPACAKPPYVACFVRDDGSETIHAMRAFEAPRVLCRQQGRHPVLETA